MKDILKKYKNHRMISNVKIVLASLILAVLVNFFLLDWTILQNNIKASILDTPQKEVTKKADIYLENIEGELSLKVSQTISSVKALSLSFTYNPDNVNIEKLDSSFWELTIMSNTPWITSIILTVNDNISLEKWDNIVNITASKKESQSENLNIINANFSDNKEKFYLLTTSWVTF